MKLESRTLNNIMGAMYLSADVYYRNQEVIRDSISEISIIHYAEATAEKYVMIESASGDGADLLIFKLKLL